VAILRTAAGHDPYDKRLSDLIGELSTRSAEFRLRWAAHNVKSHRTGAKMLHHPLVGDLVLDYEALELPATRDSGSSSTTPYREARRSGPSTSLRAGRRDRCARRRRSQPRNFEQTPASSGHEVVTDADYGEWTALRGPLSENQLNEATSACPNFIR
jgi:hypothetical protein